MSKSNQVAKSALPGGIDWSKYVIVPSPRVYQYVALITPELARTLIASSEGNRVLKVRQQQKLQRAITDGKFALTGETIIIDADGHLVDGHHRLTACIQTGIAIQSCVVVGVHPDVKNRIDGGVSRTYADILAMEKTIGAGKNTRAVAAAVAFLWKFQNRKDGALSPEIPSTEELDTLAASLDGFEESVALVGRQSLKAVVPPSSLVGCHYLFNQIDPLLCEAFFADLESGAGLQEGSPALAYLNVVTRSRNRNSQAKVPAVIRAAILIKAWNAEREGRPIKSLMWRPASEPFPEPR